MNSLSLSLTVISVVVALLGLLFGPGVLLQLTGKKLPELISEFGPWFAFAGLFAFSIGVAFFLGRRVGVKVEPNKRDSKSIVGLASKRSAQSSEAVEKAGQSQPSIKHASDQVEQRIRDFRELIGAAYGKSAFNRPAWPKDDVRYALWERYASEKSSHIDSLLKWSVSDVIEQQPQQGFRMLCERSKELGTFIRYYGEQLRLQGANADFELLRWYNNDVVREYRDYAKSLKNSAEILMNYFDDESAKELVSAARSVEINKPDEI